MQRQGFLVRYDRASGLVIDWDMPRGICLQALPLRVYLRGTGCFSVWSVVDSGEEAPAWAEPELALTFFGTAAQSPDIAHQVERVAMADGGVGYRAVAVGARAAVTLELRLDGEELRVGLAIANPQPLGGRALPLCVAELCFEEVTLGAEAVFLSALPYGGQTFAYGKVAELTGPGVSFAHGCIGLALPLLYLHDPQKNVGLQCEFMLNERPIARLRPGSAPAHAACCLTWSTERLLEPGQTHCYGGTVAVRAFVGTPVAQMRHWRDAAATRYGLTPPPAPAWARRANIIEFNMNPENTAKGFTRLDDPKCRALLQSWKEMGFTVIYGVSDNHVGQHWLSPFDYEPCEAVGGRAAERQMLAWVHELGLHMTLWVTTVGIDRDAREVAEHADWFTHRRNGDLFYAWDSTPATQYRGYAPDADPLSAGWRRWLQEQVRGVIGRGYDGIFIDGCIPRASNHARWSWPGESRNGVEDQVRELAAFVRTLGDELITFVEDARLSAQLGCELTHWRYKASTPRFIAPDWDQGMQGGPTACVSAPPPIPPEMARDYLLVRYASLLPGAVSSDVVEGYYSEAVRPWTVQSLFAGMVPKPHSEYLDTPEQFVPWSGVEEPSAAEQQPAHRLRGHAEFLQLLRYCRDEALIREAPLSIDGVIVDGDAGVVGMLHPTPDRCLLALIQFADRPAHVGVRLTAPDDVPLIHRALAGHPEVRIWRVQEIQRSMVNAEEMAPATLSPAHALEVTLGAFGFRIFELVAE